MHSTFLARWIAIALVIFAIDAGIMAAAQSRQRAPLPLLDYPHWRASVAADVKYCDNDPDNKRKDTDHKCECPRTGKDHDGNPGMECNAPDEPGSAGMEQWCTKRCKPNACKCHNEKCS